MQNALPMQQMDEEEQGFNGRMWTSHASCLPIAVTEDSSDLDSHQPNSIFARLACEAQQLCCSGSYVQNFAPSCSSICSSSSTVSGSTHSSTPSMSSSAKFGSMPCIDMTGYHFFQNSRTYEPNSQQSADCMPSTYWVDSCPWDSAQDRNSFARPSRVTAGMDSTRWVGSAPCQPCGDEIEEFSLGSGYQEYTNSAHC